MDIDWFDFKVQAMVAMSKDDVRVVARAAEEVPEVRQTADRA
jgi:hypothetical protein